MTSGGQFERSKNDRAVQKHVDIRAYRFDAGELVHLELVSPGADVAGELASNYFG